MVNIHKTIDNEIVEKYNLFVGNKRFKEERAMYNNSFFNGKMNSANANCDCNSKQPVSTCAYACNMFASNDTMLSGVFFIMSLALIICLSIINNVLIGLYLISLIILIIGCLTYRQRKS